MRSSEATTLNQDHQHLHLHGNASLPDSESPTTVTTHSALKRLRQEREDAAMEIAASYDYGDDDDADDAGSGAFWRGTLDSVKVGRGRRERRTKEATTAEDIDEHVSSRIKSLNVQVTLKNHALLETVPRHFSLGGERKIGHELPRKLRRGGRVLAAQLRPNPDIFNVNHPLGKAREAQSVESVNSGGSAEQPTPATSAWNDDEGYEKPHEHRVKEHAEDVSTSTSSTGGASVHKFKGAMTKKLSTTRKRTLKLFADLDMPTDKQLAFLAKYSSSFEDTEMLDVALQQWEEAAQLISLREFTLDRLKRLERGDWLEPFELFSDEEQDELRRRGSWVIPPSTAFHRESATTPVLLGVVNDAMKAKRSGALAGDGFEEPLVGSPVLQASSIKDEIADVHKAREQLRKESIAWLRRILHRVTGNTLKSLRTTDERFGDTVTYQGRGYAAKIAAQMAGKSRWGKKK